MSTPLGSASNHAAVALPSAAPAFVGRADELALLEACLDETIRGRAQLVLLRGDAGIGKTRLLREMRSLALVRAVNVCSGRCYEDLTLPYLPFVESLLSQLNHIPTAQDTTLEEDTQTINRFLQEIGALSPGAGRPVTFEADHDRLRVFLAIARATVALGQIRPLLLLVDDLHWADQSSLDLFSHLVFSIADAAERGRLPIMIVGSYRQVEPDHPLYRAAARFNREPICRTIELTGLSEPETDALLQELGLARASQQLLAMMARTTRGNPLFIQEVLHQLQRRGALQDEGGYLTCSVSAADLQLPGEVTEAIRARLRALGRDLRQVLTCGSVLGERFTLPLLGAICQRSEEETLPLLEEAIEERLLTSEDEQFQFAHPLIRYVLYSALSAPHRHDLHRQAAEALEALYPDNLDDHVLALAHHLIEAGSAGSIEKVASYARRAGDRSLAVFAWNDAARFYTAAVAAAEAAHRITVADLAHLHYWAAFAHYRDLDVAPSLRLYEKAILGYQTAGDLRGLARALVDRTRAVIAHGATTVGEMIDLEPLEDVLRRLGDTEPGLSGELLAEIADVSFVGRQEERAHDAARRALAIGRRIGDDRICTLATTSLALAQWQSLALRDALETFQEGRAFARRSGDMWAEGWPVSRIPLILVGLGRIEEASKAAEEAFELGRTTRDWAEYSLALSGIESVALARGDFNAAEGYAQQVLQMAYRARYPWGGIMALQALAGCRALRGAWAEAEDAIALLVEPGRLFEETSPFLEAGAWLYQQLIRVHAGDVEQVRTAVAANPGRVVVPHSVDLYSVQGCCTLVELAEPVGDPALAAAAYEALNRVAEQGTVFTVGWLFLVPRLLGVAAGLNRWWDKAERHFQEALTAAADAGSPPEFARSCLDYARMLAAQGRRADQKHTAALLRQATSLFISLDMEPFRRQAMAIAETLQIPIHQQPPPKGHYPDGLTERETRILVEIAKGRTDQQIAENLLLRPATVANYADSIYRKTGAAREEARAYAARHATRLAALSVLPQAADAPSMEPVSGIEPQRSIQSIVYPDDLSTREVEVLRLLAVGKTNREIAAALTISVNTVYRHVGNIFNKTGAANRTEAAAYVYRRHLLD